MSGHTPFSELTRHFSPERLAEIEAETNRLREEEMTLQELRKALGIEQGELGSQTSCCFSYGTPQRYTPEHSQKSSRGYGG